MFGDHVFDKDVVFAFAATAAVEMLILIMLGEEVALVFEEVEEEEDGEELEGAEEAEAAGLPPEFGLDMLLLLEGRVLSAGPGVPRL